MVKKSPRPGRSPDDDVDALFNGRVEVRRSSWPGGDVIPGSGGGELDLGPNLAGMDMEARDWAIQHIVAPFALETIQPQGFDKDKLNRLIECLSGMSQPRGNSNFFTSTIKVLISMDFAALPEQTLIDSLGVILAAVDINDQNGPRIFGQECWDNLFVAWADRVRSIKASSVAGDEASDDSDSVVVVPSFGNTGSDNGNRIDPTVRAVISRPLPRVRPAVREAYVGLIKSEFPYATRIADDICKDLVKNDTLKLKPRLVVGPPGIGKTSFLIKTCQIIGAPYVLYPCGGDCDSATFRGASRKWSTTAPSFPLTAIAGRKKSNLVIILDEIEKAARGRHNGNILDVLLGMIEETTAKTWYDPHIEAPINLSHINWLASANTLDGLPEPLLDRFNVSVMDSPGLEHGEALVRSIAGEIDPLGGASDFDYNEIQSISRTWGGGSIRRLRKIMDKYMFERARVMPRH